MEEIETKASDPLQTDFIQTRGQAFAGRERCTGWSRGP